LLHRARFLGPDRPAIIIGVMIVAAVTVHLKNGFFAATNGFEVAYLYAAGAAALLLTGPGAYSVGCAFRHRVAVDACRGVVRAGGGYRGRLREPAPAPAAPRRPLRHSISWIAEDRGQVPLRGYLAASRVTVLMFRKVAFPLSVRSKSALLSVGVALSSRRSPVQFPPIHVQVVYIGLEGSTALRGAASSGSRRKPHHQRAREAGRACP
jgi:hypothetical protein